MTLSLRTSGGESASVQPGTVEALRSQVHQLPTPDSPGYDEARAIWDGMIDRRHGLIARCEESGQVARGSLRSRPRPSRGDARRRAQHRGQRRLRRRAHDRPLPLGSRMMCWWRSSPPQQDESVGPGAGRRGSPRSDPAPDCFDERVYDSFLAASLIMRTHGILLFLFLLLWLVRAPALDAQDLPRGAIVRIHPHESSRLLGRVVDLSADTLWLRIDRAAQPIPLSSIRQIEWRQRRTRAESGWTWAKRGFMAGALLGGATCIADRENCTSGLGPRDGLVEGLLAASLFAGGGVAFLGFLAGAVIPGHRWVEIHLAGGDRR